MLAVSNFLSLNFPWILIFTSTLGMIYPQLFAWYQGQVITISLAMIMLLMGTSLTPKDFEELKKNPTIVFLAFFLQYTLMPALGYSIASILNLSPALAAGLILVSTCPGGTASNVITFLAGGDLALSVTMTSFSTLGSILLTPTLATLLIGDKVDVSFLELMKGTFLIVLIPVTLGFFLRRYFPKTSYQLSKISPGLAVLLITFIVASILSSNRDYFNSSSLILISGVFLLHILGFAISFLVTIFFRYPSKTSRTVAIETGMQNSGLGVVLARNNLPDPVSALPSAISSVVHSIIGSLFAAYFRNKEKNK